MADPVDSNLNRARRTLHQVRILDAACRRAQSDEAQDAMDILMHDRYIAVAQFDLYTARATYARHTENLDAQLLASAEDYKREAKEEADSERGLDAKLVLGDRALRAIEDALDDALSFSERLSGQRADNLTANLYSGIGALARLRTMLCIPEFEPEDDGA